MTADEFNAKYPVGTKCRRRVTQWDAWVDTTTRSESWALGHGAVVVCVTGKSGGVLIDPEFFEVWDGCEFRPIAAVEAPNA